MDSDTDGNMGSHTDQDQLEAGATTPEAADDRLDDDPGDADGADDDDAADDDADDEEAL